VGGTTCLYPYYYAHRGGLIHDFRLVALVRPASGVGFALLRVEPFNARSVKNLEMLDATRPPEARIVVAIGEWAEQEIPVLAAAERQGYDGLTGLFVETIAGEFPLTTTGHAALPFRNSEDFRIIQGFQYRTSDRRKVATRCQT
jgi:hypothetical protein